MVGEGGGGTVDVCVSVCDGIKVDKHVRIHKTAAAAADGGSAGGDYRHTRKNTHQYKRHRRRLLRCWSLANIHTHTESGSMPGLKPARLCVSVGVFFRVRFGAAAALSMEG